MPSLVCVKVQYPRSRPEWELFAEQIPGDNSPQRQSFAADVAKGGGEVIGAYIEVPDSGEFAQAVLNGHLSLKNVRAIFKYFHSLEKSHH